MPLGVPRNQRPHQRQIIARERTALKADRFHCRQVLPDPKFRVQRKMSKLQCLTSQFAMSNTGRGGRRTLPYAFTEHGALQAANVLSSPRAVAMSVYIIRAFVKMREEQAANAAILKRLAEIDRTLLQHDTALRDIYQKLRPLLAPPPDPPKREIGFHIREKAVPYRVRRKATV
jgi:hypothetical protein